MRVRKMQLAIEFAQRLRVIALREADQAQQPMQAEARVAIAARHLTILHGRSLAEHGFGLPHVSARHVNHRHLKVREGEIGIQRQRVICGSKTFVAPGGVTESEKMPPIRRFKSDGPACDLDGLLRLPSADEQQRQRRIGVSQRVVERDGSSRVMDGALQQVLGWRVVGACHFIGRELGARETCQRQRIARVDLDRLLEIGDRSGNLAEVERFEMKPGFGVGPIRLEARRFMWAHAGDARP